MIQIKNIVKTYGEQRAVDNLSLEIPDNTIFGFLGANGAGKTTTLKMLVGLSRPESGEILLGRKSPLEAEVRNTIGFLPESPTFYEYLTGFEFLEFSASLLDVSISREKVNDMLKYMGIWEEEIGRYGLTLRE